MRYLGLRPPNRGESRVRLDVDMGRRQRVSSLPLVGGW